VEVIEPMFMNLRDVTRFATSARPTLTLLGHEIDFVDLVALVLHALGRQARPCRRHRTGVP
jgi:hypothetical protein